MLLVLEAAAGYSITVIPGDPSTGFQSMFYSFTASGETAILGAVSGGGSFASAGPVSITK